MSDIAVIYTEMTKETDPIGGIWSAEPFAMTHVAWVTAEDFDAVDDERNALIETVEAIKAAAESGDLDEVLWLAARALA